MKYFLKKWDCSNEDPEADEVIKQGTLQECKVAVPGALAKLGGGFKRVEDSGLGGPYRWESRTWCVYIVDEQGNEARRDSV